MKRRLAILAVVGCCTSVSFGISNIFPQGDRWLEEWQLSHLLSRPLASSIVLVRTDGKSPVHCAQGQWNLPTLESTFFALHQAGASVIAPMITVSLPIPSECGGLSGLVNLAEVTKHVGSVVYPDSVPPALAQAAIRTGTLQLTSHDDERVSGLRFNSSSLGALTPPLGAAVAKVASTNELVSDTGTFLFVPSKAASKGEALFSTYSFTEVWNFMQAGNQGKLVDLFNGKIVFLFSESPVSQAPSTTPKSNVPIAVLHAQLANSIQNNSWVSAAPVVVAFLVAISLGSFIGILLLGQWSLKRLSFIGLGIGLSFSVLFFLGFLWNWTWPLFSMTLALGMTILVLGTWRFLESRATVQQQIHNGEQQLIQLQRVLSDKEHHARQLEDQLSHVQCHANHSESALVELQTEQHTSLSQLEKYQVEVRETRRKIDRLQEELLDLRQHVPVTPTKSSLEPQMVDDQDLIHECKTINIVTRDPSVLRLFQNLKKAAATQVPILLLGETGTGKEVFAKAAHALSPRRQGPFISVNMAAIRGELFEGELFGHVRGAFTGAVGRTGFLESAHGGTLFLDEVGDLPLDLQAKLLRFLEDGGFHRVGQSTITHVDVRIVAATNRDLQDEVRAGRYREDLYYRLRSIVLTLPPLRTRNQADHVLLAQSFLMQYGDSQHRTNLAFTQGALDTIIKYPWPGNIRELRQTIAQAVALSNGSVITEAELNLDGPRTIMARKNWVADDLGQREDAMVLECLRRHKFEMKATADTLGWDRGTVTQRLKGLGFQAIREHQGDVHSAAVALAGDERFVRVVEERLREYVNNLVPNSKHYGSAEEAIADCRKRFRNLPERHFPAVEQLLHERFAAT